MSLRSSRLAAVSLVSVLGLGAGIYACKPRKFNSSVKSAGGVEIAYRIPEGQTWDQIYSDREKLYNGYLTAPDKKHKTMFNWYTEQPLGLNGVPWLVLRVLMDMYPDIWTASSAGVWQAFQKNSLGNKLGFPTHPLDYNVTANPALNAPVEFGAYTSWGTSIKQSGKHPLPFGFVSTEDLPNDANDTSYLKGVQTTFFSCAACHTSRVMNDKRQVRYYVGGASTEVDPQAFAYLIYQTATRMSNVGEITEINKLKENPPEPKPLQLGRLLVRLNAYNCTKYKPNLGPAGVEECKQQKRAILAGIDTDLKTTAAQDDSTGEQVPDYDGADSRNQGKTQGLIASLRKDIAYEMAFIQAEAAQVKTMLSESKIAGKAPTTNLGKIIKNLIGGGVKTHIMYLTLGKAQPFRPQVYNEKTKQFECDAASAGGQCTPNLFGPRPGQMDAFGLVQGIVFLNAMRPDLAMFKYFPNNYVEKLKTDSKFESAYIAREGGDPDIALGKQYADGQAAMEGSTGPQGKWNADWKNWYTKQAALSDVKSLFESGDEVHANWDGNQGAGARVLASGVSSVGDPTKVFTEIHESQNEFLNKLPSPPYPFEDAKNPAFLESAKRGQKLFEKTCATCHHKSNGNIYDVGTDPNRSQVIYDPRMRLALVALTQAACEYGKNREAMRPAGQRFDDWDGKSHDGRYWCEGNFKDAEEARADILRKVRGNQSGYKADALHGIWMDAPYFHNGSVPNLREVFAPQAKRSQRFWRGNINYDMQNAGYLIQPPPRMKAGEPGTGGLPYPEGDSQHGAWFDTSLRGNTNAGHEMFFDKITPKCEPLANEPGKNFCRVGPGEKQGDWTTQAEGQQKTQDIINFLKAL